MHGFLRLIIDTLPLEIEVTRRENWDPINRFNPATFAWLFQPKTCISNLIFRGHSAFSELS